jgi:hypothetical protein
MTYYMGVLYESCSVEFNSKNAEGLLKALLPGCESVVLRRKDIPGTPGNVPLMMEQLYNFGKGGWLSINLKDYYFTVHLTPHKGKMKVQLSLDHHKLLNNRVGADVAKDFVRRTQATYDSVKPRYAIGDWDEAVEKKGVTYKTDIFWLNFYSPQVVKKIGREKLMKIPHGTVNVLADGGIFLLLGASPGENNEYREDLRRYLFGRGLLGKIFRQK